MGPGPESLITTRAALARVWLGDAVAVPIQLGAITLHPHQASAVARLERALAEFGGALLADETGLGKTYVAAALIARARRPLVIAPAGLRAMWHQALTASGTHATVHSVEALSRGRLPEAGCQDPGAAGISPTDPGSRDAERGRDLVVVDEAHHFRNPHTRRYAALSALAIGARVLLLSATPVHNRRRDLIALLALFLGAQAADETTRGRVIVRRLHTAETRPRVDPTRWLTVPHDDATLDAILALPPPVPPSDGGSAGALVALGLIRQWASSSAALRAALRRRLERAGALASALECGRHPTDRDIRGWCLGDGAVQLAFPELLIPQPTMEAGALLSAVRAHEAAVAQLLRDVRDRPDPDIARGARLRAIIARHPGQKIVAFSVFEDTVRALARRLARDARVCALGSRGGVVANGTLTRAAAIARFAPLGTGAADAIDVLLATDLLSEGVNLQDASVIVHLDLPWTPARIEQRIGRAARLGSPHACVTVYAMAPPVAVERCLGVQRRLEEKLRHAARGLGTSGLIVPRALDVTFDMRATCERWLAAGGQRECQAGYPWAAIRAPRTGYLAAVRAGGVPSLVVDLGDGPTDDTDAVARAVSLADGPVLTAPARPEGTERAARAWGARRCAARDAGTLASDDPRRAARRIARRIARAIRRAPAHRRPIVAALAARARRALAPAGAGTERALAALVDAALADEAWLTAVAALARAPHPTTATGGAQDDVTVLALLLFRAAPSESRECRPGP